jgi:hypothetical protein
VGETCFVPLLGGVVAPWEGTPLALALDATTVGTRLTVWALSVVYRGWAIPVAWTVLAATAQHAWRRERLRMLRLGGRAIPRSWTVLGLAERGWYARWLFRRITRLGWPPFVCITPGGTFRPPGHERGVPLKTLVPAPGTPWQGTGIACQGRHRPRHCPLLARWEAGYQEPWLLLTALPPETRTACWYGLRAWSAQGVKITKRAGWQWQRAHMTKPERAARRWLAVAVATLGPAPPRMRRATCMRLVSILRWGWTLILVAWLNQAPRPRGRFVPAPEPAVPISAQGTPSVLVQALPQAA